MATDRGFALPHRTIDRATRILEVIAYQPGMTLVELNKALDAPKTSVRGFVHGLVDAGWLHEDDHRFYLGSSVHALTLAIGNVRAGLVTQADLEALHAETGAAAFLGAQTGEEMIYIAEAGADTLPDTGFAALRMKFRWTLLSTSGGKALLAEWPDSERSAYLLRWSTQEPEQVAEFLDQYDTIRKTRIATNIRQAGARYSIGTTLRNQSGDVVASVTLVGRIPDLQPRLAQLSEILLRHVDSWSSRTTPTPREAI